MIVGRPNSIFVCKKCNHEWAEEPILKTEYILALDPAQLHDWSALCAVKMLQKASGNIYQLVNMERKQKQPYPLIVDWAIAALKTSVFQKSFTANIDEPELILDTTGVGVAINDMFRAKNVFPIAASITAGNGLTTVPGIYHLGKARLIGMFLAALDSGRVQINPNLPIYPQLEREMINYRAEITESGNAKFNSPEGEHDDMLFALALSVWWGEEARRPGDDAEWRSNQ